ncbi:hypothetical protein [Cohnella soli]|uniref:Uncharacterized protein n=1 Tax=Cohnella soli TaxID=425005 RepID=A0ABW0HYZ5_9BACL
MNQVAQIPTHNEVMKEAKQSPEITDQRNIKTLVQSSLNQLNSI